MNLREYAARQPQPPAEQPSHALEVQTPDQMAARLDAEKLARLKAALAEALEDGTPVAGMLADVVRDLYGADSPQAARLADIIEAERTPGGHEMALAHIRQRRSILRKQAKQLEALTATITAQLAQLDEDERAMRTDQREAATLDAALADVLTYTQTLDTTPDAMTGAERLYTQHMGNPAAMGLLYGALAGLARQQYADGALDLIQARRFDDLRRDIAAACGLPMLTASSSPADGLTGADV